ncbi:MAG: hypothetical protein ACYDGN_00215 [Acidimicrobiales bacterium]
MPAESYFVPTDDNGKQHLGDDVTQWPLPTVRPDGGMDPGAPIEPAAGSPLLLRDLDGLLDDLGERIFFAEVLEAGPGAIARARLTGETKWDLRQAARFALDCAEHVVVDPSALVLPSGVSLADVFRAAREYLERDETQGDRLLQRMSRLALARRLRHLGQDVADLALQITLEDEADDLDALDDPAWTATASIRDAVLSAMEAIRHDAFPRLFEAENRRYESDVNGFNPPPEIVSTPWGNFSAGTRAGVIPAWFAARDAAERARRAISDQNGPSHLAEERSWQRARLAGALGLE